MFLAYVARRNVMVLTATIDVLLWRNAPAHRVRHVVVIPSKSLLICLVFNNVNSISKARILQTRYLRYDKYTSTQRARDTIKEGIIVAL